VRGKIIKIVSKVMNKAQPCVVCGQIERKNKSLMEVELPCGYKAEFWICRPCSGEKDAMRNDSIELLNMLPHHYHIEGRKDKTFWDFLNALIWIKEFQQFTETVEEAPGIHVVHAAKVDIKFFRCEGLPPSK
jgi:hypothetical protein